MRVDPTDKTGTKFIGDLAESWTVSPDKRTYTFKLRQGVKFHDGAVMTSKDVKASYDKIVFPPPGIVSSRKEQYKAVEAVEAPTPDTVVFRLKYPEASFIASVSSPWNWIYRAEILAKDPHWYEKNINGHRARSSSSSTCAARTGSARRTPTTGTRGSPTSTATAPSSSRTRGRRWRPSAASAP